MDLTTTYLGLTLAHPFVAGASPLSGSLDTVKRLEDGGAAAIVLPSLFEEQVTMAESGRIHQMDPLDAEFAESLSSFPLEQRYAAGPDEYLEHLRHVRKTVGVPVIASLNGMTGQAWLKIAFDIQEAGAHAVELNIDEIPIDPRRSAAAVEAEILKVLVTLKRELRIPVVLKLSPFFTAFGALAHQLDEAGADGLVLFNRLIHPDIDLHQLKVVPRIRLSTSAELPLRLHWLSVLRSTVRASLGVAGGVATVGDGIKSLLAGADAVHIVSAVLRHGPTYFQTMREGLRHWAEAREFSLSDVRGRLSIEKTADASLYERANYIRSLQGWNNRT